MVTPKDLRQNRPEDYSGKEIFEVQPIILGGSPTDSANKIILTREEHIAAVRYWNKVIHDLRQHGTKPQ